MTDIFQTMYDGSWYTITGAGGDLQEWRDGYQKILNDRGIGTIQQWYDWTGRDMNDLYCLTGSNRYPDDLHFLGFCLDGLDIPALAILKIEMGDRWYDDIVDNNRYREEKKEG